MKRVLFLAIVLGIASPAASAVIERDWKTPGDGLLTFDTVHKREWLDLSLQFSIPTPRYDNVVAELGPGGMFEGFSVASIQDVTDLAESAGMTIGTSNYATNGSAASQLIDLLGPTSISTSGSFRSTRAQVLETTLIAGDYFHIAAAIDVDQFGNQRADLTFHGGRTDGHPSPNSPVFLVRAVPESDTSLLAMIAWSALARGVIR